MYGSSLLADGYLGVVIGSYDKEVGSFVVSCAKIQVFISIMSLLDSKLHSCFF